MKIWKLPSFSAGIFPFLFLIVPAPVYSQNIVTDFCASDAVTQQLFHDRPALKALNDSLELEIYRRLDGVSLGSGGARQIYTIPVVVHIIHNNGPENISDAQVIAGIQHLNDGFRNAGAYQSPNGADVGIEFCLAAQDPNGNATNGITRTQSSLTNVSISQDAQLKSLSRWNQRDYFNIWLVNEISGSVIGYAYLAVFHGLPQDGIVCEARYFGTAPNKSKVQIHEAGHYLNLRHTFQNGCPNNNCLSDGDHVCDTPPDDARTVISCAGTINSCTTDDDDLSSNNPFRPVAYGGLGDQNDMFLNYMDYGNLSCTSGAYTQGQKNRMITALTGIRSSLLVSNGCQSPCPNPITASFTSSATSVFIGATVNFTNTSTGATGYDWKINGTSFSTSTNASYSFNNTGTYTITLTASNSDPNCTKTFSVVITVSCTAQASFTPSATQINPGESVTFTNTSTGATSYQWFVDNVSVATTANYSRTFAIPGIYEVFLVTTNATCSDTSTHVFIQSGSCSGMGSKRANMWYFGRKAAISFNSGAAVALTNSAMNAEGGCATISDNNGNLQFYSDGDTIWNKNHQMMPNWDIDGNPDNVLTIGQGVFIVPKPGDPFLYYVFNFKNPSPGNSGFQYSIVDSRLDNGNGDVMFLSGIVKTGEIIKLVVPHGNGQDYWIIAEHDAQPGGRTFSCYRLTNQGFINNPVISQNVGSQYSTYCTSVSSDYRKVAFGGGNGIEVLNFDNATGVFSSGIAMSYVDMLSVEFSPNGSLLYGTEWDNAGKIHQWDMNAGSLSAIINSRVTIYDNPDDNVMVLKRGPDQKIYVNSSTEPYLYRIDNPDLQGLACGFTYNAVYLAGRQAATMLPSFPDDFLSPLSLSNQLNITGPPIINEGAIYVQYRITGRYDSGSVYAWTLRGYASINAQTDSTIFLDFHTPGTDTLIITQQNACNFLTDTFFINVTPLISLSLGNDTAFCNSVSIMLDAGTGFASYLWQDSSSNRTFTANTIGTYWVQVTTVDGYTATDTLRILDVLTNPPSIDNGGITSLCPGKIAVLDAGDGYYQYVWQDGWNEQTYTAYEPGNYVVTVTDPCGNSESDSVIIASDYQDLVNLGNDTMICNGNSVTLIADSGFTFYAWQDGSSAVTYTVSSPGEYWVAVTNSSGCQDIDTIAIEECTQVIPTKQLDFSLYPNPTNGIITLQASAMNTPVTVTIYDALGKQYLSQIFDANEMERGVSFNLNKMIGNVFFLKLNTEKDNATVKVLRF